MTDISIFGTEMCSSGRRCVLRDGDVSVVSNDGDSVRMTEMTCVGLVSC